MTRPDPYCPYDFDVKVEETITFVITTVGTSPHIVIVHGGTPLAVPYSFQIDKPAPHIHVVETEFDFDPDASPTAHYDIQLKSSDGTSFSVPSITLTSGVNNPGFAFGVISTQSGELK
jgi:hypothetical protein